MAAAGAYTRRAGPRAPRPPAPSAFAAAALAFALAAAAAAAAAGAPRSSGPPRQSPAPLPPPEAGRLRITALGTGVPRVMRSQATASFLVQLDDGGAFLFDIGDGALTNLIQAAPGAWGDTLFLTHLHSDHTADSVQLLALGPMLGGREGPLHVYGPSGPTPETGTAAFVAGLNGMLAWDRLARRRVKLPRGRLLGGCGAEGGGGGGRVQPAARAGPLARLRHARARAACLRHLPARCRPAPRQLPHHAGPA
ncbi:hypothetical protein Rsub_03036 [Raphidocelis subcapitata]|uniref:Metallo-beta-lactamase domain-containing protein n=1 Tax=Raphidocelis subcapitata TaxID=307507 RepID=A0A2V0P0W8_9CHLO|nr:hypothetical protein Rsub_03036 [Raphidocelis subcapitata]|eukprot:GBF90735.1 hypothetical protein Rsub_03036 [Raphidocelis subcapitata]